MEIGPDLRILLHEIRQKISRRLFTVISLRDQTTILGARDRVLHCLVRKIDFRHPELLQLGADVGASLRLFRYSPAALVLFNEFIDALLELFAGSRRAVSRRIYSSTACCTIAPTSTASLTFGSPPGAAAPHRFLPQSCS